MLSSRLVRLGQQFVKFALVGGSGAVVDFSTYLLLTRQFPWWLQHFLLANVVAFLLANFNNYLWHRQWTFAGRAGGWWRQYVEFLSVSSIYLLFIQGAMWLMVRVYGYHDVLAKLIAVGVGVGIYFTVVRRFIFRPRAASASSG